MTNIKTLLPLPRRLVRFFQAETAGGVVMIISALLALIVANSDAAGWYQQFVSLPVVVGAGDASLSLPLHDWVKDVLMVLFFLLIGMELKREMVEGVLADKKQIVLPLVAAIGGMVVPAVIYLLINLQHPAHINGWAIPTATDIAFAVCVLALVCRSAPPALKIFLLAIAIFDDLGAILVIAFFYNHDLEWLPLAGAVGVSAMLLLLGRLRMVAITPYMLLMAVLWYFLHEGGIHTTLAGVITGLAIPLYGNADDKDDDEDKISPLATAIHFLHPWVAFCILPIFAFTASGVVLRDLTPQVLLNPLPLSLVLALFFGKQIGIFGGSWLLIRLKLAALPEGTNWRQMYGVSVIAGIGFTMSLFIGILAFDDRLLQEQVKIGVIAGSLLATFWGWLVLRGTATSPAAG